MENALIAHSNHWSFVKREARAHGSEVRIKIAMAGICRTDIQAMQGLREVDEGRILGHEAAGTIEYIPPHLQSQARARGLEPGTRVAFFPFLPCKECEGCLSNAQAFCAFSKSVGLDCDGAFANTIDLPLEALFKAPANLSWKALAYAEPVAAAMGVWSVAAIDEAKRIAVMGRGRIAKLTKRILELHGRTVDLLDPDDDIRPNEYDVVVETWPTAEALKKCALALRPGGTLVVKSRPAQAIAWPHQEITLKSLRCQGAPYAPFALALERMSSGSLDVSDMLGKDYPFTKEGIEQAVEAESQGHEQQGKLFFRIDPCAD